MGEGLRRTSNTATLRDTGQFAKKIAGTDKNSHGTVEFFAPNQWRFSVRSTVRSAMSLERDYVAVG